MSNDPVINSALFNFCNRLDDGPREGAPSALPRSKEDLEWLKQALAAIEAPDKILKQHLQIIELAMGWTSLGGGAKETQKDKGDNKAPKPTALKLLADGVEDITIDDVIASLDYLVEELEDINMATEFCLMNGPAILLNLLQVSSASFVAPPPPAALAAAPSASGASTSSSSPTAASSSSPSAPSSTALSVVPDAPKYNKHNIVVSDSCFLKEPPLKALKHHAEVRELTAKAIAHAVQQNPKAQQVFAVMGWAEIVIPLLSFEVKNYINPAPTACSSNMTAEIHNDALLGTVTGATVAALLHICSCMSRENDEGASVFLKKGGVNILELIIARPARVSAKILKRALFLVEYFASIGISNKSLIVATANIVLVTGSSQVSTFKVTTSPSTRLNGALSDPIPESVLYKPEAGTSSRSRSGGDDSHHGNAVDDGVHGIKADVQRTASSCLVTTLEKGRGVVSDILKPMGLSKFLTAVLKGAHVPAEDIRWKLAKELEN